MRALFALLGANPATITAAVWLGVGIAAASAGAAGYAAWEVNGWRLGQKVERAERERDLALAQGKVLAEATRSCSAGVDLAKKASDGATALGAKLLDEARRLYAGNRETVASIEAMLKKPPELRPDGKPKTCDDAWDFIEQDYRRRNP